MCCVTTLSVASRGTLAQGTRACRRRPDSQEAGVDTLTNANRAAVEGARPLGLTHGSHTRITRKALVGDIGMTGCSTTTNSGAPVSQHGETPR
ncbi:hypothetical protein PF005_g5878 [Phytophthora fragariae]|uniref:Uncharacterized protein n=1 Tax=Phytophthora fragariae TaxID=53985 RepID=A0A6A3SJ28_9STRA|nr:hypothetical protein PF003_g19351 [Phytophthora fragariae]KAE8943910.1 hypothetical protein PF009_g6387 [Phytophthora fragariae]KAE9014665.1 hypothetical protein PF011_g7950 [Phytophthora fragariae]KAE9117946.1 hypothetical protein PF007_g9097 [Phytophthora fragariae]KAE9128185.1 hypothetical protein PF010_g4611 [Phytophthora fragariae]